MAILTLTRGNEVKQLVDLDCCDQVMTVCGKTLTLYFNGQKSVHVANLKFDDELQACRAAGYLKMAQESGKSSGTFRLITETELYKSVKDWSSSKSIASAIANALAIDLVPQEEQDHSGLSFSAPAEPSWKRT